MTAQNPGVMNAQVFKSPSTCPEEDNIIIIIYVKKNFDMLKNSLSRFVLWQARVLRT
jgi:hypothetical protein